LPTCRCVPVSLTMISRLRRVRSLFPFHFLAYLAALRSTVVTRFFATMAASDSRNPSRQPHVSALALPLLLAFHGGESSVFSYSPFRLVSSALEGDAGLPGSVQNLYMLADAFDSDEMCISVSPD
jgi:hypothetical protein